MGEHPVGQMGHSVVQNAAGDEVSALWSCKVDEGECGGLWYTLESSSACWSCSFIHAPKAGTQAAAQVGQDWDSQPSPALRSMGWPGAVHEKYLEPTQKLLVLNLWRASSSKELAPKQCR